MKPDSLLTIARSLSRGRLAHGVGCFTRTFHGVEVVVTYRAPDSTYEVGTLARLLARGKRRDVLATLEALISPPTAS